ncbi:MAG TPA: hypothetical protein VGM87_18935 [Roseomonas sp.]|jgi:hypothetical protein
MKTLLLGIVAAGLFVGAAAGTAPPVDCGPSGLSIPSPDGRHRLDICRATLQTALPGQSGGASGLLVLRDTNDRIEGVVGLSAVNILDNEQHRWDADAVELPQVARIPYAHGGATMLGDAFWRLRVWLRAIPRDEDFR